MVLPDVYIGIAYRESDLLKELSYHELAHASHFTKVTKLYWEALIAAEMEAWVQTGSPHGSAKVPGAGIISVCESWAYHLGYSYAHRTYGGDNSAYLYGFPSWGKLLEHTWNEVQDHIPIGLYNDLSDNGEPIYWYSPHATARNLFDNGKTIIDDNVSGFTNAQMFDCMDDFTLGISDFKSRLRKKYLSKTNNDINDYNALFSSY